MTIDREDGEQTAAEVKLSERLRNAVGVSPFSHAVSDDAPVVVTAGLLREAAELARSVEDAAVAHVEWDGGADLTVYFDGCPDEDLKGCRWNAIMSEKLDGQRVRLVPEAGQGDVDHG